MTYIVSSMDPLGTNLLTRSHSLSSCRRDGCKPTSGQPCRKFTSEAWHNLKSQALLPLVRGYGEAMSLALAERFKAASLGFETIGSLCRGTQLNPTKTVAARAQLKSSHDLTQHSSCVPPWS